MASVLGGVLFVAWGYIHRPDVTEPLVAVSAVLSFVVPVLFLGAVVGLSVLWRSRLGVLGWLGIALAVYGLGWDVVAGLVGGDSVYAYFAQRGWSQHLNDGLFFMLSGLTLVGIATVRGKPLQKMDASLLATATFGWAYYVTDTGAVLEARLVHVGSGLLFSLGWVMLGAVLLAAGTRPAQRPQARG